MRELWVEIKTEALLIIYRLGQNTFDVGKLF